MSLRYSTTVEGETLEDITEKAEKVLADFFSEVPTYHLDIDSETWTTRDGDGHVCIVHRSYSATVTVKQ